MVRIETCGIMANRNGRTFKTNLCVTPNGTRVCSTGMGYMKVNSKNEVNGKSWYVGNENGYELWQSERADKNGDMKIVKRKVKIK